MDKSRGQRRETKRLAALGTRASGPALHSAEPWTTGTGQAGACKASARDGASCGLPDEPPDAWPACPVVWEEAGRGNPAVYPIEPRCWSGKPAEPVDNSPRRFILVGERSRLTLGRPQRMAHS